jgi:hypothetical protein
MIQPESKPCLATGNHQEWKVTMQTSNTRARKFSSKVGKVLMALIFALMIGGISASPAFSEDYHDRHGGYHRDGRHYDRHYDRHEYRRHAYRGGYYSAPVYAPPPVVYDPVPYQSPGINLIFPIRIR